MLDDVFTAVLMAAGLLLVAEAIRRRSAILRRFFIPAALVAGTIAVLLGPQVAFGQMMA